MKNLINELVSTAAGIFPGSKAQGSDASALLAAACNGRLTGTQSPWYSLPPSPSQLQMPFTLAFLHDSLDFDPLPIEFLLHKRL